MCQLSNHTKAELEAMTKEELIALALEGVTYSEVELVKDEDGNDLQLTETIKDADGKTVSTKVIDWTYYNTGEVNKITIDNGEWLTTIKHYEDGKKPDVTKVKKSKG